MDVRREILERRGHSRDGGEPHPAAVSRIKIIKNGPYGDESYWKNANLPGRIMMEMSLSLKNKDGVVPKKKVE